MELKKYIVGFVLGGLLIAGGVFAKDISQHINIYEVDSLKSTNQGDIVKVVDEGANVICYTFKSGYSGGISCLKNI